MTNVMFNSAFSNDSLRNAAGASENGGLLSFHDDEFGTIRSIVIDGIPMFVGSDVARSLGYKDPNKAIQTHCKSGDPTKLRNAYMPHSNGMGGSNVVMIGESNVYRLIMRSNLPDAERFQDWIFDEVVPAIMRTGKYMVKNLDEPTLEEKLIWIEGVKRILNLNESSSLALLQKASEGKNLPLPDYVPSKGVLKSATDLLKANGVEMSAKAFNKIAINKGVLVEKERKSTHGIKRFKNISDGWLDFGENQVCPNNPRETQPLWYESRFRELLERMELI